MNLARDEERNIAILGDGGGEKFLLTSSQGAVLAFRRVAMTRSFFFFFFPPLKFELGLSVRARLSVIYVHISAFRVIRDGNLSGEDSCPGSDGPRRSEEAVDEAG